MAPIGAPPPDYATGVAYSHRGLILLTMSAPQTWEPPDLEVVLVHELSHVALYRAVLGNHVPRWFNEGVAIQQSEVRLLPRMESLLRAAAQRSMLRLSELDKHFPNRPHEVNIAYAQSADVVGFLRRSNNDPADPVAPRRRDIRHGPLDCLRLDARRPRAAVAREPADEIPNPPGSLRRVHHLGTGGHPRGVRVPQTTALSPREASADGVPRTARIAGRRQPASPCPAFNASPGRRSSHGQGRAERGARRQVAHPSLTPPRKTDVARRPRDFAPVCSGGVLDRGLRLWRPWVSRRDGSGIWGWSPPSRASFCGPYPGRHSFSAAAPLFYLYLTSNSS